MGPKRATKRWCPACHLRDDELVCRSFPDLSGAALNQAVRRWQREEALSGKLYRKLAPEATEPYAPVVADGVLLAVLRVLRDAQGRREAQHAAGGARTRRLLVREAVILAGIVAPRQEVAAIARLAGRHWVALPATEASAARSDGALVVTKLGQDARCAGGYNAQRSRCSQKARPMEDLTFDAAVQHVTSGTGSAYAFQPRVQGGKTIGGVVYLIAPNSEYAADAPEQEPPYQMFCTSGRFHSSVGEEEVYMPEDVPEEAKALTYHPTQAGPADLDYELQIVLRLLQGTPLDQARQDA